jgi:hypothetical protein
MLNNRDILLKRYFAVLFILCLMSLVCSSQGQKLVPDTIYIDFRGDSVIQLNKVAIREINDLRDEHPGFLRSTTTKKFLVVPVDIEVYTVDSLALTIVRSIPVSCQGCKEYRIDIEKFEIMDKNGRFSSSVVLTADMHIYEFQDDTIREIGTLFYDYPYRYRSKKESLEQSTENLMYDWQTDFKLDLLMMQAVHQGDGPEITSNFISDPKVKSLYLNTRVGAFAGLNWYGFQGELFFMRPETKPQDRYSSGIIRYQNCLDYESFSVGRKSGHRFWRRNRNLAFDIDANILMGVCNWKDIETSEPALYQLFDFEVSSVQSMVYNPLNKDGFTFRGGIIENANYVIGRMPTFHIGIFAELGFKF